MQKYIDHIENLWQKRADITPNSTEYVLARGVIAELILRLDMGAIRVCHKNHNEWIVNEWVKKAILLFFAWNKSQIMQSDIMLWYDKIPMKFDQYHSEEKFAEHKSRIVPGAYVRKGAYIGSNVILMPSFVNIGAYIDDGTMIDSWATIGSCAQIGKNCHISSNVVIGGVLEPLQAKPVIIEDNCFIGAGSSIVEGVIIEKGAVIAMGVSIGASTKIYNSITKEISYGVIPAFSVVIPGSLPDNQNSGASLYCAVIIKKVDESTRAKTSINELLRS